MGQVKRFMEEQEAFDDFIALLLDEADDNLTERPKGTFATLKVSSGPTNERSVDGIVYDYPSSAQPTKCIFMPDHNPRKYLVLPANDWEEDDEDVGYHGLRASDL
jgi:hypothetical protein